MNQLYQLIVASAGAHGNAVQFTESHVILRYIALQWYKRDSARNDIMTTARVEHGHLNLLRVLSERDETGTNVFLGARHHLSNVMGFQWLRTIPFPHAFNYMSLLLNIIEEHECFFYYFLLLQQFLLQICFKRFAIGDERT